jgi:hypothetical protein
MNDKDEVDEGSKKEVGILDVRPAMATRNRSKSRRVSVGFTTRGGRGGIQIWCRPKKACLILSSSLVKSVQSFPVRLSHILV